MSQRAPYGMTYAPCHLCKGERQGKAPRDKEGVCRGCRQHIDQLERREETDEAFKVMAAAATEVRHPEVRSLDVERVLGQHAQIAKDVAETLGAFFAATGFPVEGISRHEYFAHLMVPYHHHGGPFPGGSGSSGTYRGHGVRRYTREQVEAAWVFVANIEEAIRSAYAEGHDAGSSLLKRLQQGDLTVFEFDVERERVEYEAKHRRRTYEERKRREEQGA